MQSAVGLASAGLLALLVSAAIIPFVLSLSHKRAWYDIPNERKIHTDPIPRLGGIGIFFGTLVGSLAIPFLVPLIFPNARIDGYALSYLPVFLAFGMIHGMGLVDDFHNLSALLKLAIQIIAASLVTVGGFTVSSISFPGLGTLGFGIFSYPITVLWIVAISNAINLVDGVDGLAGGISGIAATFFGVMCLLQGRLLPAVIAFSLVGACVGFLLFNLPPARLFMGDSGSLFIGFALATLPLMISPGQTSIGNMMGPVTVLFIPILDMLAAIIRRLRGRRPIHSPDKEHIHHKLLALGLPQIHLLLFTYAACIVFGGSAIVALFLPRVGGDIFLVAVWLAGVGALWLLNRASLGHEVPQNPAPIR
jgi:UDP-GlcNAc:undecaprenyl-phosphate/decaprenyl-phosphate GlcNAc-1-phosphate transferase